MSVDYHARYTGENSELVKDQKRDLVKKSKSDLKEDFRCNASRNGKFLKNLKKHCNNRCVKWALLSKLSPYDKDDWVVFGDGVGKVMEGIKSDECLKDFKIRIVDTVDTCLTEDYSGPARILRQKCEETAAVEVTSELFLKEKVGSYDREQRDREIIFAVTSGHVLLDDVDDKEAIKQRPTELSKIGFELHRNAMSYRMYMNLKTNDGITWPTRVTLDPSAMFFDYYCYDLASKKRDTREGQQFSIDIAMFAISYTNVDLNQKIQKLKTVSPDTAQYEIAPEILVLNPRMVETLAASKTRVFISSYEKGLISGTMLPMVESLKSYLKLLLLVRFYLDQGEEIKEGNSGTMVYLQHRTNRKLYKFAMFKGLFSQSESNAPIYHAVLLQQNIEAISAECSGLENFENIDGSRLYEIVADETLFNESIRESISPRPTMQFGSTEEDQGQLEEISMCGAEEDLVPDVGKSSLQNKQQQTSEN